MLRVRILRRLRLWFVFACCISAVPGNLCQAANELPASIVVAADGSGDYQTIQEALNTIPYDNPQRVVIQIRNGIYQEKIRIDPHRITLRGESRNDTRIQFNQPREAFEENPDNIGVGVVNIYGNDCILENLTIENTIEEIGPHAFAVFGRGTRTIIQNSNCVGRGADTVAMWNAEGGMYYHANCSFQGAVDFVCPRGYCFIRDSQFYEHKKGSASIWHDGDGDRNEKFVLKNCSFDGVPGFRLGRRHREGHFYLIDCTFSENMDDQPIWRVTYPDEPERNQPNLWGDRYYYFNCRREGGEDFPWYANNLAQAPGSPRPQEITPKWTFEEAWAPQHSEPPKIIECHRQGEYLVLRFTEDVTVLGRPRIDLIGGGWAIYADGSGHDRLRFRAPGFARPQALDSSGGGIVACTATVEPRFVPDQPLKAE